jgi:hypothetical protein
MFASSHDLNSVQLFSFPNCLLLPYIELPFPDSWQYIRSNVSSITEFKKGI